MKPIHALGLALLNSLIFGLGLFVGSQIFADTTSIKATFTTPIPEDEDATFACLLEAGTKTLDCADYMMVTTKILERNRCACKGVQQPDEGDDE